jgi:hypothetical protein
MNSGTGGVMYRRYRHLVIEDPDEAPSEDEIRDIEQALDAKLPYDFLDFLDTANGGSLDSYFLSVPLTPNAEDISFGSIFSTKCSAYGGFLFELEWHTSPKYIFQIPERVLPIASGAGETYLYLDLRSSESTPVTAFIRGLPDWTGLHAYDTVIKVADNFTDYIAMLKFDVEDYKEHLLKLIAKNETKYISATIDYLELALPNWREVFGFDYDDGRPKQRTL